MNSRMPQKERPSKTTDAPSRSQPEKLPDVRVVLIGDDEIPTAALVEERLRHLRQLYAVEFLLRVPVINDIDMLPMIALILSATKDVDLEDLVPVNIQIRSAGTGSPFWVDLFVQMLAHLPTGADLKQWADYLKNAQSALVAGAGLCTWLVTHVRLGRQKTAPNDAVIDTWNRIKDSKKLSEEQKEEIRDGMVREMEGILGPESKGRLSEYLPPK